MDKYGNICEYYHNEFKPILTKNMDLYSVEYHKNYMIYKNVITPANSKINCQPNEQSNIPSSGKTHVETVFPLYVITSAETNTLFPFPTDTTAEDPPGSPFQHNPASISRLSATHFYRMPGAGSSTRQ
jgi:hypothetical protein